MQFNQHTHTVRDQVVIIHPGNACFALYIPQTGSAHNALGHDFNHASIENALRCYRHMPFVPGHTSFCKATLSHILFYPVSCDEKTHRTLHYTTRLGRHGGSTAELDACMAPDHIERLRSAIAPPRLSRHVCHQPLFWNFGCCLGLPERAHHCLVDMLKKKLRVSIASAPFCSSLFVRYRG